MADRKKMEGHCSTGQSPQWAVVPMEEDKEFLTPRPTPKLEDHPLSSVIKCLYIHSYLRQLLPESSSQAVGAHQASSTAMYTADFSSGLKAAVA